MDRGASELTPGRATAAGTRRYAARFRELEAAGHFRQPERLTVSSLGLGMRGGRPGGADDVLYRQAVGELLAGGVNLFDTALSDRMQASERCLGAALGRAFRQGDAARDEVVVVTKGGFLGADADVLSGGFGARRQLVETYVHTGLVDPQRTAGGVHSLDPPFLRDQIERSRRNLRLETIDLYLIEEPELHLSAGASEFQRRMCGAFEALERAVADGVIAGYGLCTWDGLLLPPSDRGHLSVLDVFGWALDVAGGDPHLCALQLPYSVALAEALRLPTQLGPTGATTTVLSELRGTGTLVLASAPFVQGRALGRLPDFVRSALPGLHSDAQRCLQFVRSSPGVTAAIAGMREPEHVRENLAGLRVPPVAPEVIDGLFKADPAGRAG